MNASVFKNTVVERQRLIQFIQPWAKVTFSATKLALFVLHQQWSVNHKNSTIVISIED